MLNNTKDENLFFENLKALKLYYPFLIQNIVIFLVLCLCLTDTMDEGDYIYAWGKCGIQGNMNDESILPEEIDPTENNKPRQRSYNSTSVPPSVFIATNTLQNFSYT